jgi:hypothetical protein
VRKLSNVEEEKTVSPIVTEENHPTITPKKERKSKKAKKTQEPKVEQKPTFPVEGFVNPWGFIHLKKNVVEAFGATMGQKTAITIDLQEGTLVVKKA